MRSAAVVEVVRRAHASTGAPAPRRPWLPPLPDDVLTRPGRTRRHRRRSPSSTSPTASPAPRGRGAPTRRRGGSVGLPRTGRSTTLRALVHAAARDAARAPAARAGHRRRRRPRRPRRPPPRRLRRREPTTPPASTPCSTHLEGRHRVPARRAAADARRRRHGAARGRRPAAARRRRTGSPGCCGRAGSLGAVAGGPRALLRPRWSALGGEVLLLGTRRPPGRRAARGPARGAPGRRPPPGRGVRGRDDREVQVVARHARRAAPVGAGRPPAPRAPPVAVPSPAVRGRAAPRSRRRPPTTAGWLLGVAGPTAGCGAGSRSATGGASSSSGRPGPAARASSTCWPARRPTAGRSPSCRCARRRPGQSAGGVEVLGPDDAARLVVPPPAHPDLLVLVDDVHRLDDTPVRPLLEEIAELIDRDGGRSRSRRPVGRPDRTLPRARRGARPGRARAPAASDPRRGRPVRALACRHRAVHRRSTGARAARPRTASRRRCRCSQRRRARVTPGRRTPRPAPAP